MIALALVGALVGAAVCWLLVLLRPPRPDPLVLLARYDASRAQIGEPSTPVPPAPAARSLTGLRDRIGGWLARELTRRGFTYTSLRQDLALCGRSFETTMGRKVLGAVAGLGTGLVIAAALANRVPLPAGSVLIVPLLLALGFFFIPDYEARSEAGRRRRQFRKALRAYLTWVHLMMANQASAEAALPAAAAQGGRWPMALIRHTVANAGRDDTTVWDAFTALGRRIGVPQLTELGTLTKAVAQDGAQVRETLAARAASLASEELAEAKGTAGKRDQSMLLAQVLLGIGFTVFIGYPAIITFLHV